MKEFIWAPNFLHLRSRLRKQPSYKHELQRREERAQKAVNFLPLRRISKDNKPGRQSYEEELGPHQETYMLLEQRESGNRCQATLQNCYGQLCFRFQKKFIILTIASSRTLVYKVFEDQWLCSPVTEARTTKNSTAKIVVTFFLGSQEGGNFHIRNHVNLLILISNL